MNKKELAKLLLKHPLIKQIKESKGIDKKDFNRILAEEIMNEENLEELNRASYNSPFVQQKKTKTTEQLLDYCRTKLEAYEAANNWEGLKSIHGKAIEKAKQRNEELGDFNKFKTQAVEYFTKKIKELEQLKAQGEQADQSNDKGQQEKVDQETQEQVEDINSAEEKLDNNISDSETGEDQTDGQDKASSEEASEIIKEALGINIDQLKNFEPLEEGFKQSIVASLKHTKAIRAINKLRQNFETESKIISSLRDRQKDINTIINDYEIEIREAKLQELLESHGLGSIENFTIFNNKDFKIAFTKALTEDLFKNVNEEAKSTVFPEIQQMQEALSGIFLEEEGDQDQGQEDDQNNKKTGPINPSEAAAAAEQLQKLQAAVDAANLQIDVQKLWSDSQEKENTGKSTEEQVEEAKAEGEKNAEQDAQKPSIEVAQSYVIYKKTLDKFFSEDGANDGFMDQFLLKFQSQRLWELIGTLNKIVKGETEKTGDTSDEMGAFTRAKEKQQLQEADGQQISDEGQVELKTSLVSMLQAIKKLKVMIESYERNMTKSSSNPALDGSSIMESLKAYMENLQEDIAKVVERCASERQRLNKSKEQPDQQSTDNKNLQEADGQAMTRDEKIDLVNNYYTTMRNEYIGGLVAAMTDPVNQGSAVKISGNILKTAQTEEFISLFPSAIITSSGTPASVNEAVNAIGELIKTFIKTMKNVITLAKGQLVDSSILSGVISDLLGISKMIENYFKVSSKIPSGIEQEANEDQAKNEENKSLTDNPRPPTEEDGSEAGEGEDVEQSELEQDEEKPEETTEQKLEKAKIKLALKKVDLNSKAALFNMRPINEKLEPIFKDFPELKNKFLTLLMLEYHPDIMEGNSTNNLQEESVDSRQILTSRIQEAIKRVKTLPKEFTKEEIDFLVQNVANINTALSSTIVLNKIDDTSPQSLKALIAKQFKSGATKKTEPTMEESLKPIILKMLNEHYSQKF
jgi:hypothetical protein